MNLYKYGELSTDSNWQLLCHDMAELLKNGHGLWKSQFYMEELFEASPRHSISDLYRYAYEREAREQGKYRLFIKNNHVYNYAAHLISYFSKAKFIYLVRDPRDMALEWERSPLLPGGLIAAAATWKTDQRESIRLYAQLKEQNKVLLVRFEELLTDSKQVLSDICAFLDLEYTDQLLNFYKSADVITNSKRISAWSDLAKPLMKTNCGFYRAGLNEDEIRYIESVCSDEMDFLCYPKDYPDSKDMDRICKLMEKRPVPPLVRTESEDKIYAGL